MLTIPKYINHLNKIRSHIYNNPVNPIKKLGINNPSKIYYNLSYNELLKHEINNNEGKLLKTKYGDVYSINTGVYTGRSPKDKWIVKNVNSLSNDNIWWGDVNQPINSDVFNKLYNKVIKHYNTLDKCYVYDGYCGANSSSKKHIRFVHEMAWQQHFVTNMFIDSKNDSLSLNDPDFTIINACSIKNDEWKSDGLNSDVVIALNIEEKIGIIMGTWYGGENKKGIFSLMNYWLPMNNILTMHCSANVGKNGDSALFFGLSGTGKTTLSSDPNRYLIGDDEHGWDETGIFNLEGGCYAKTINLSEDNEPDIYKAIRMNALLENVYFNDNIPDYNNTSITENGRVSYPINHITNWEESQKGDHPKNIILLTCDAFGVLPPVSKLSIEQAMYYFISGYTAKVAGTERGIKEPVATFSPCFGSAFLTLHPSRYAKLFEYKINKYNSNIYLVNTGWIGGGYGVGNRISIKDTRKCIDSILSGDILKSTFENDNIFNLNIPTNIEGIDSNILNPKKSWKNIDDYNIQSEKLSTMFKENYNKYIVNDKDIEKYLRYGPKTESSIIPPPPRISPNINTIDYYI